MAWYKTGTVSINNLRVTGSDTGWSKSIYGIGAGQILLVPGAGSVQMFEIASVDSDTQLTLVVGPGVPINNSNYAILSFYGGSYADFGRQLSAFLSEFQGLLANWQAIMTNDTDVTVIAPDGTEITFHSFVKLSKEVDAKADRGANNDITSLLGLTTPLSLTQGGTGARNGADARLNLGLSYGTTAGTVAQGNDNRLNTIDGKSGGVLNAGQTLSAISNAIISPATGSYQRSPKIKSILNGRGATDDPLGGYFSFDVVEHVGTNFYGELTLSASGNNVSWSFAQDGSAWSPGSWNSGSDQRMKTDLIKIPDALNKVHQLTGYTGKRDGKKFTGLVAQDLQTVLPEAVSTMGEYTMQDGTVINDALAVAYGDIAGLFVEAIKELSTKLDAQSEEIASLKDIISPAT